MPQLPSGGHIGVLVSSPEEIVEKLQANPPEGKLNLLSSLLSQIRTVNELPPYVHVIFFRKTGRDDHNENAEGAIKISSDPETWIEPYRSGFVLTDLDLFSVDWSDEDKTAFQAFVAGDSIQNYFQKEVEGIIAFSDQLSRDFSTRFVSAVRQAGLHPDQDEVWSEEASPEWDSYDMLAALGDVVSYVAEHPEAYQAHSDAYDRATGIWQMLIGNYAFLRNPVASGSHVREIARVWRAADYLNHLTREQQEWLHKQLIIECVNLWNHAGETLERSCSRAYAILTLVTVSPEGAEWA